jgi:hypothetical protein
MPGLNLWPDLDLEPNGRALLQGGFCTPGEAGALPPLSSLNSEIPYLVRFRPST